MDATQKISVADGKLVWPLPGISGVLVPVGKDQFYSQLTQLRINFTRDAKGKLNGLTVNSGRIQGLGFKRL